VPSFKAPTGDTTASRIKTLVIHVDRVKGRAEADDFLQEVGVARDVVHDETRPVSVAIWRKALESFARRYGTDEIARISPDVVHTSNLGPWVHVLRNAESIADAYRLLEGATTNLSSTTRIETLEAGADFWRGRLHVLHDPALERGGLLATARVAELMAVPTLFGFPPARVRETASLERGDGHYAYEARWVEPGTGATRWLAVVVTAIAFAVVGWITFRSSGAIVMAVLGAAVGVLAVRFWAMELARRAQVKAQSIRIRALERSLELQEIPDRPTGLGELDGQVIAGLYRLHARLGAGATGVIYEALRISDRAPVAVKLLRAAVAQDTVASDRLRREAEALRLAWHPNVVELYDHGVLPDGTSYLVMELLKGETLATKLAKQKRLSPREIVPVVEQICDALMAVHAAGVIHRDLKPSNIYLCETKQDLRASQNWIPKHPDAPRVKMFDFGIARVEWAETRITNIGVPLGTPGYMAPEQEAGEQVDSRIDIYALGATIYECLTGNPPPLRARAITEGGSLVPARWEASTGGASKPIDDRWKAIVDKAMAPNPEDRYPDARALLAAVQSLSSPSDEPGSGAHASEGASEARRADGSATRGSGAHSIDKSKKASSI
jgi:serine/threonine-protein kinase